MHPRAERIVAHLLGKLTTLNLDVGGADGAKPEEKRIAESMFDYIRTMHTRSRNDSGHSSELALSEDYDEDEWTDITDEDSCPSDPGDLIRSSEETTWKVRHDHDSDKTRAEIKILCSELDRLDEEQYFVMKTDMVMEREMKIYKNRFESERRHREEILDSINEERKHIYSLLVLLAPAARLPKQKPTFSVATSPPQAKTSTQSEKSHLVAESPSDLKNVHKIETNPVVVPVGPVDSTKTSTQSVDSHPEVNTSKNSILSERSRIRFFDLTENREIFRHAAPKTEASPTLTSLLPFDDLPPVPDVSHPQLQTAQLKIFEQLSQGQSQQRPLEQATHQSAQSSVCNTEEALKLWNDLTKLHPQDGLVSLPNPTPQDLYAKHQYSHGFAFSSPPAFEGQKPQGFTEASCTSYGTCSGPTLRDPAGQSREDPLFLTAQDQSVQASMPMYYNWYPHYMHPYWHTSNLYEL